MSDHIQKTIEELREKLAPQEAEVYKKRRFINELAEMAGMPPVYSDLGGEETEGTGGRPAMNIRPDQFFGRPTSTIAREYLEMRKSVNPHDGPATLDELFEALKSGGAVFEGGSEEIKKRGLSITLAKNSAVFIRIPPHNKFGLIVWYPGAKKARKESPKGNGGTDDEPESPSEVIADPTHQPSPKEDDAA